MANVPNELACTLSSSCNTGSGGGEIENLSALAALQWPVQGHGSDCASECNVQ